MLTRESPVEVEVFSHRNVVTERVAVRCIASLGANVAALWRWRAGDPRNDLRRRHSLRGEPGFCTEREHGKARVYTNCF